MVVNAGSAPGRGSAAGEGHVVGRREMRVGEAARALHLVLAQVLGPEALDRIDVQNDPINLVDPEGLWVPQAIGAAVNLGFEGYRQYKAGKLDVGRLAVAARNNKRQDQQSSQIQAKLPSLRLYNYFLYSNGVPFL